MNSWPKISLVTPVFNQAAYLERTIRSVLDQGYPNLEYIIIDGGSTDGTLDIIERYSDRLAFWMSESDSGMYDALQKGFARSSGDIMGWLNADDLLFGRSLFAVASVFAAESGARWFTGASATIDEADTILSVHLPEKRGRFHYYGSAAEVAGTYLIYQASTFWKRSLWEECGSRMETSMKYAGDFELWLRFMAKASQYICDALIGSYRIRKGQLSSELGAYEAEMEKTKLLDPLSSGEERMFKKYRRKIKIAAIINKTKVLDGERCVRLLRFQARYDTFPVKIKIT